MFRKKRCFKRKDVLKDKMFWNEMIFRKYLVMWMAFHVTIREMVTDFPEDSNDALANATNVVDLNIPGPCQAATICSITPKSNDTSESSQVTVLNKIMLKTQQLVCKTPGNTMFLVT
ncbi:hypothetical protein BgiMline_030289 [Biomphalaria glabrata]